MRFGHKFDDIKNYTLPQIRLFYANGMKAEAAHRASFIEGVRLGAWGDAEVIEKVLKELRGV